MEFAEIFRHVDHTALGTCSTWDDVKRLCEEAAEHGMASVCIPPSFVKAASQAYGGRVTICTVIGFPLGYQTTEVKVFEARDALANGANEIDMVVNLGWVKEGNFDAVTEEIRQVKEACGGNLLKVIVEACYLLEEEKINLCRCVTQARADFIKTSTGFGTGGATLEDIELFRTYIGPGVRVKASGGLRSYKDFVRFLEAGCQRLGTSSAMSVYRQKGTGDSVDSY